MQNILYAEELMGRYSNLVLVQNGRSLMPPSGWILRDSEVRQLPPGLFTPSRP